MNHENSSKDILNQQKIVQSLNEQINMLIWNTGYHIMTNSSNDSSSNRNPPRRQVLLNIELIYKEFYLIQYVQWVKIKNWIFWFFK